MNNGSDYVYGNLNRARGLASPGGWPVRTFIWLVLCVVLAGTVDSVATAQTVSNQRIRGTVISLSSTRLQLATSTVTVPIVLNGATQYLIDSSSSGQGTDPTALYIGRRNNIRVGDTVEATVYRAGRAYVATEVRDIVMLRYQRTLDGTAIRINGSQISLRVGRQSYAVHVPIGIPVTVNGTSARLPAIHAGYHIHVTGQLRGAVLTAQQITASKVNSARRTQRHTKVGHRVPAGHPLPRHVAPKPFTLRGTVLHVHRSNTVTVTIVDRSGHRRVLQLSHGVGVQLNGRPADLTGLFATEGVTATGLKIGTRLIASLLQLSAKSISLSGRIANIGKSSLLLHLSNGSARKVNLSPPLVTSLSSGSGVSVGVYVQVLGAVENTSTVYATRINFLRPALNFDAHVRTPAPAMVVQTAQGEKFRLRFTRNAQVFLQGAALSLSVNDIPTGALVRVMGIAQSDGTVQVTQLAAHLSTVAIGGRVIEWSGSMLSVRVGSVLKHLRLAAGAKILQGSHTLSLADVVVGDNVTVLGYAARPGIVLTTEVIVLRKVVQGDGTVASLLPDGFILSASDGVHRVIVGSASVGSNVSIPTLAVGSSVHVVGYLRGDGVILATTVQLSGT